MSSLLWLCPAPVPAPPRDEEDGSYLDDEGLALEAGTHSQQAHVRRLVDEVLDAVENSSAGGGDPTVDSSLADGLPGDTGVSVDVLKMEREEEERSTLLTLTGLHRHRHGVISEVWECEILSVLTFLLSELIPSV